MWKGSVRTLASLAMLASAAGVAAAQQANDPALEAKARAIHDRVIALDTHVDIDPKNFTTEHPNYTDRLNTQVNLPKIAAKGKKVALMGVENAYGIGTDLTNIKKFYDQGARYMSLAHNGHSQMSDSNTGERDGVWLYHGLSPLGKQAVAELNRVGIMIDISHPSKESMMQTLALTKAPIIASHSAVRALCDVSRNLDDEQLLALKKNGGVVQMVAFSSYVKKSPPPPP